MMETTIYELVDTDEGYPINEYTELSAALTVVIATMRASGEDAVNAWGLLSSTPTGARTEIIAEGRNLVARARL